MQRECPALTSNFLCYFASFLSLKEMSCVVLALFLLTVKERSRTPKEGEFRRWRIWSFDDVEGAIQIWSEHQSLGIEPNMSSWTALLQAMAQAIETFKVP